MIFGGICGLKSKVPTFALLPASLAASIALSAIGAPRVTMKSIAGFCFNFAEMVERTDGRSDPFT